MTERSFIAGGIVPEPLTRREQKASETRAKLIDTALDLFAKRGYEATSIRDIAREAGVAQGLLYNYFPGKEDLFWAILQMHGLAPHLQGTLEEYANRPVEETLRAVGWRLHAYFTEREPLMRLILSEVQTNPKVAEVFAQYVREESTAISRHLQARIDSGELRPHNVDVTLRMLIFPIIMLHVLKTAAGVEPKELIEGIVQTLLRGIAA